MNFLWNLKNASLDNVFPKPLLGIPIPDYPKAAHLISSAIVSLIPSV